MLAAGLIVFREILEAALIVTIVLAATKGVRHRVQWIISGIGGGVAAAAGVAALTNIIAESFSGSGQEVFNAVVLLTATALISWHLVWMNAHGRELAQTMRAHGKQVADGEKHMAMLAFIVGLAVMREGAEIVLMLQGLWASGAVGDMIGGATLGLAAGLVLAGLMYAGFLALPIGRVFSLTNGLLALIAAGMAARGATFLAQAGYLPVLHDKMWDTSFILSEQSFVGQIMAALVGYIARPTGIEVVFYGGVLMMIAGLMTISRRKERRKTLAAAALVAAVVLGAQDAQAASVKSPYVTARELELEHKGLVTTDRKASRSNKQEYEIGIAYAPTSWYKGEAEVEWEREAGPNEPLRYSTFAFENVFALADRGEY